MKKLTLADVGYSSDNGWETFREIGMCGFGSLCLTIVEVIKYVDRYVNGFPRGWAWAPMTVIGVLVIGVTLVLAQYYVLNILTNGVVYLVFGRRMMNRAHEDAKIATEMAERAWAKAEALREEKVLLEQKLARYENAEYRLDPAMVVKAKQEAEARRENAVQGVLDELDKLDEQSAVLGAMTDDDVAQSPEERARVVLLHR